MQEPVNLRQVRKRKIRAEAGRKAEEQRVKHGRTRAETSVLRALDEVEERRLDGHRRDRLPSRPVEGGDG